MLRRSGCKGEKICFILDESNMLDSSFLERMNTLLANGEVPGLFEGESGRRGDSGVTRHERLGRWWFRGVRVIQG